MTVFSLSSKLSFGLSIDGSSIFSSISSSFEKFDLWLTMVKLYERGV